MPRAPKTSSRIDTKTRIDDEKRRYSVYDKRVLGGLAKLHQVSVMTGAEVHVIVVPENPRRMPIVYSSSGRMDDALRLVQEQEQSGPGICRYDAPAFAPIAESTKRRIDDKLSAKGERIGRTQTTVQTTAQQQTFDIVIGDMPSLEFDLEGMTQQQVRGSGRGSAMWPSLASRSK